MIHRSRTSAPMSIFLLFLLIYLCSISARKTSLSSQFLAEQNAVRRALGLPPLIWDSKLARYAEWYANQRRRDCELKHSNGPYGENIFWGSGEDWSASDGVASWVGERQWYKYRSNSCAAGQQCGHYTQIVWSSTRKVGCAMVTCLDDQGMFIICNYDPPGNYIGERPY